MPQITIPNSIPNIEHIFKHYTNPNIHAINLVSGLGIRSEISGEQLEFGNTLGSHAGNGGSNPPGVAIFCS